MIQIGLMKIEYRDAKTGSPLPDLLFDGLQQALKSRGRVFYTLADAFEWCCMLSVLKDAPEGCDEDSITIEVADGEIVKVTTYIAKPKRDS